MNKHLLFASLLSQLANVQEIAKGTVFNDLNNNSKLDNNEKGIPGVSVSNGIEVVATDQNGRYQLPVGKDNILFVSKPSGYSLPLDEKNQPQFYYIHKPSGTPKLKYAGVPATGKLPTQVNFPLKAAIAETDFTALVFGNPQAIPLEKWNILEKGLLLKRS